MVSMEDGLFADVVDSLQRMGCQFWACDGPQAEPEHMKTCHRCWLLIDMRTAGLIQEVPVVGSPIPDYKPAT